MLLFVTSWQILKLNETISTEGTLAKGTSHSAMASSS